MKFNFFGFGKKAQPIRNPKIDTEFLEAKKIIDEYLLLKLKEAREIFFFEDIMDILVEYKVVSYENRNKIKKNFLKTLESILTEDEKLIFAKYYQFEQFELKVYRYFIKEVETLNILLKTPETSIKFLLDFSEQDKEIYKFIRNRDQDPKKVDQKYLKKIFENIKMT